MSYQVLARKWRPQTFEEVVGQSGITQTLANAIRLNRIGHAFLFCGSRGIGKTTTARILAKALNCESGPTDTPCNTCRHCREIIQGNAMDVVEIDGVSNRGIDEIRELRENVKYTPATARFKVIIIDEVHMLTREAFNALLKTLEEPPPHAKFILATTEAHKVPVTIVSRCQRYDFRRIDVATLTEFLRDMCRREDIQAEDSTLEVLARMADGGLRDSLSLLDQVISFSGREIDHEKTMQLLGRIDPGLMFDVFRYIAGGNGAGALERFGAYVDGGGSETVFHREMLDLTRDILTAKMNAPSRSSLPEDLPELFSVDQLERIFNVLLDLEQSFRQTEFPRLL
ncbi:MAG TPA: DNA polymerase III subunit gamma/tau, partial [bacterium]|nr:DNA polymerase III subunit gamma/tau [bacterium]